MSPGEIAVYLGLTVETFSRSISKLKKRCVISLVEIDEVVVLDDALFSEIGKSSGDVWQGIIDSVIGGGSFLVVGAARRLLSRNGKAQLPTQPGTYTP